MKKLGRQNLLFVSFCYDSEKCFISIIKMNRFAGKFFLLVSFCYDSEKCCISIIGTKIFLGQNLLVVSFGVFL